jgi:hypothetical protein
VSKGLISFDDTQSTAVDRKPSSLLVKRFGTSNADAPRTQRHCDAPCADRELRHAAGQPERRDHCWIDDRGAAHGRPI